MPLAARVLPQPFREGDRMSSAEFLTRWEAMPELKHAELIDGTVFLMPSPIGLAHGITQIDVGALLWSYAERTPGCQAVSEVTWVMGTGDVPQPDLTLRILPEFGGESRNAGNYGGGAPELIVEVTESSLSRDLGSKLELYRRTGVREYITVLLQPKRVIWRELVRGRYREIKPDDEGLLKSRVFPGLWLDPETLWNRKSIRAALEKGLASAEHAAFVKRLGSRRKLKK
ncbi:MAG: Uma2 family endonuclease [Bryobacteraceae bacterium]